ncbi:tudor domain-containing protein qin [Halictus rubicundus]|uniref:tudor domain-containing protein qin n=1 Tax=Halictus rubicundus TaxID=77578 RepID=UPI0040351CA8
MFSKQDDKKQQKNYKFPLTKLKNVYCTYCKHQFFLQEFIPLRGLIPLLMECGHIVCDKCAKLAFSKPCPSCHLISQDKDKDCASMPIHIYTLGLMVSSHNRLIDMEDLDISFTKPSSSKLKQQCIRGFCQECGIQALVKCPQCDALYCFNCYAKIHGRALNSHSKIILSDNVTKESCIVQNTCSEKCKEPLGYFCETCEIARCSHCILKSHKHHNYVSLLEKNQVFLEEFRTTFMRAVQKLQRVHQGQKKLNLSTMSPTSLQNADKIETTITQHFAHLHGVLQNMETKIIDSLHHQRASWHDNVDDITSQLKEHENRLETAILVTSSVEENLDKIDIQDVMKKLKEIIDIPCHLLTTNESSDEEVRFEVDENIVDIMQKHCTVHIPAVSGFSLQRTELLPDDYEMEPLPENISIPRVRDKSFTETKPSSLVSLPPRNNDNPSELLSSQVIRVTRIVDPFCFYVQLQQNQNKIKELHKGLKTLEDAPLVASTEVKLNGLYAVESAQDQVWYRGRVVRKKTDKNDETYTVFFIDYGIEEDNVPLTKLRNIGPTFATLPVMVFRCSLDDIVPYNGRWESNAIEAFKKIVNTNDIVSMSVLRVVGDTFYVDIGAVSYKGGGMVSIRESLTFMKYATCVSANQLMRMNSHSIRGYFKEELLIENYTNCEILFVESPSCIYVRKKNACRTQFGKIVREMMETYENMESEDYITTPYKDLPCAARNTDGNWHRGIICEVTENTVKVFFVDLGYSLILCYDSIRTLSKNFLTCRTQAIKLSLRNIKPHNGTKDQWGQGTIEFLKKHLKTSMSVRVIAWDKSDDTYSVSIQTADEGDVSQLLMKNKLVMSTKMSPNKNKTGKNPNKKWKKKDRARGYVEDPIQTSTLEVPEQLIEMAKSFSGQEMNTNSRSIAEMKEKEDPFKVQVILHQVESPDCIYVSDATCERGDIDKMIQQMQQFYGSYRCADREVLKEGMVCAAFLSKNNMYHRGSIVEIKANDEVVVFLYDVGLEETVPLADLQSLYPPFFKVPAYAFKIKLAGILPCGGSTKWPSLSCEVLKDMTTTNYNCKFYISKLEEENVTDSGIPVELWIKQNKVDGPLFPTRIEINSINRMLVEKGVALPVKEYAKKRDKILAIELKKQFMKKLERLKKNKSDVKWFKIDGNNCPDETNTNAEPLSYLRYSNSSSESSEECNTEEQFDEIPSLSNLSAWLPAKDITANKFIAMPTNLDHNGFLYLHSTEQSSEILSNIERKLEKLYANCKVESCDTVWSIGDMCIAQYHGNKKWYRGKVVKILENDTFEVEFVDYGNREECPVGTLKKHVVLENVPIQCTKCIIYRLEPDNETGKWTTPELDRIHSLLIDKKCIVSVLDRTDLFYVISINIFPNEQGNTTSDLISILINDYGFNIKPDMSDVSDVAIETSNMLSSDGEADKNIVSVESTSDKVISGFSTVLQQTFSVDNNDCSITTADVENLSWSKEKKCLVASTPYVVSEETLLIGYEPITVPQDIEYIQIELCCSITATKFYAQLKENAHSTVLNECYNQYKKLMEDLQENASEQPMITSIAPDTPCCAKFRDNVWYRCLITEASTVKDSDNIKVRLLYVDYGNDEYRTVNPQKSELYSLKKEWLHAQTLAMKCKLWNVQISSSANKNLILPKIGQMYDKPVVATVKESDDEEFMSVELYENEDRKELLYSSLINEGLLKVIVEE